jgi:hypothetical protein
MEEFVMLPNLQIPLSPNMKKSASTTDVPSTISLEPLASLNRRSENICIEPVVVAELNLRDVQRQYIWR